MQPEMKKEEWRLVAKHTLYEVSSLGNIRSLRTGKDLGVYYTPRGYRKVGLYENGNRITANVHALVAEAFMGPRPEKHDINHINGVKDDNRLANLEYCTRSRNRRHAVNTGLAALGSRHGKSKLTEEDVVQIRLLSAGGTTYREIAKMFNVHETNIGYICKGQTWGHVGGPIRRAS